MSKKRNFIFLPVLFAFSFVSFFLGWLFAVSLFPGLGEKAIDFPPQAPSFIHSSNGKSSLLENAPVSKTSPREKSSSIDQKQTSNEKESFINSSLFKEMRDNIILLFNPYKIDRLNKKETILNNKKSYIEKNKKEIQLKNPAVKEESQLKFNRKKGSPETDSSSPETASPLVLKPAPSDLKQDLSSSEPSQPFLNQQTGSLKQSFDSIKLDPFIEKIQKTYNEKNKEQLQSIEKQQEFFKSSGKFSFLVNVFSDGEKALEYIDKVKKEYPFWSLLLKAHGDHTRIYLGPFISKEEALRFKKELPLPYPFSSLEYLEEIGL